MVNILTFSSANIVVILIFYRFFRFISADFRIFFNYISQLIDLQCLMRYQFVVFWMKSPQKIGYF